MAVVIMNQSSCLCLVFLENRDKFWWFGHTYSHTKAHQFSSVDAIVDDMLHNQAFAQVMLLLLLNLNVVTTL